ncbi:MAG: metallophosphoesterase [Thalassotalea sp.]
MKIAQFSDCHLFASKSGQHHGVNVYQQLVNVLCDIGFDDDIDLAIFTGDLTQDHSVESYQLFVAAVKESKISLPIYFVSGNHDEPALLNQFLVNPPFQQQKLIASERWQIVLLNSKSTTPAGVVDADSLNAIKAAHLNNTNTLLVMHHHPIDVGFGIDRHGLINKAEFWQAVGAPMLSVNTVVKRNRVKAIICGHVHNAFALEQSLASNQEQVASTDKNSTATRVSCSVKIFTCPATSIEFDRYSDEVRATAQGPGYQVLTLHDDGAVTRTLKYLAKVT